MITKLKICSGCNRECQLWKSSPKLCKACASKQKTLTQTIDGNEAKPFKIGNVCNAENCTTAIFSKGYCMTHWKPLFQKPFFTNKNADKYKSIAPISGKRMDELKVYRKTRDGYFKEHPVCEYPGCTSTNIQLHHGAGRIGTFLTDKRYFKSLCDTHHRFVEINPLEAKRLNLSFKRLDNERN